MYKLEEIKSIASSYYKKLPNEKETEDAIDVLSNVLKKFKFKGKEFKKRKKEGEKAGVSTAKIESQPQDSGIAGWLQQGLARWMEQNQQVGKKEEGKKLNSATMAVLLRRAVAREKAMALGRKLLDPRVIALEREAACWVESKEEALVS